MKTCVFAGTFDPITIGHEYVINTCLKMFDKVVIVVGVNNAKTPFFTLEERLEILNETFNSDNVSITYYNGYLADFMKENGYIYYARGVRSDSDFSYECQMATFNENRFADIITFFLPTTANLYNVSSSMVKEKILTNKGYTEFVPASSVSAIERILKKKKID